jgi:thiol-disulfide isomerase/thioredoxin
MSCNRIALMLFCSLLSLHAQETVEGPTNEKAQKTYREALQHLREHRPEWALEGFKKADKQDGGHCLDCQKKVIQFAPQFQDYKSAETAAAEVVGEAKGDKQLALAHFEYGMVFFQEGGVKHKDEFFARAHDEFTKALASFANFPDCIFADGRSLAYLKQDDAAKAQFEHFVQLHPDDNAKLQRALRYISQPELARARMAPPFAVTTTSGQRVSLDDLQGKVVLIDFWATWCAPCREALPHMRELVKKFRDEPLLVLSVSLDEDEQKWKDFIEKNEMTWPQYRDGGFKGPISRSFAVEAIPHTFTIDVDGVLQDEHIGDASIEGKIKKLLKRAHEVQAAEKPVS